MRIEDQIGEFIVTTLSQEGPLLGAKLGARINFQFPGINLRAYRNLSTFIVTFCGSRVIRSVSKTGLDYVWAIRTAPEPVAGGSPEGTTLAPPSPAAGTGPRVVEVAPPGGGPLFPPGLAPAAMRVTPLPSTPPGELFSGKPDSAWRVFIHPMAKGRLVVDLKSAEISLVREEGPLPDGCVEIPKVTAAEHRQIAREFIPQLEVSDQPKFQAILALEDFWHRWSREMKLWRYGKHAKTWLDFRFNRLCNLFQERVRSLGASESVVAASLENLKRLKHKEGEISLPSDKTPISSSMRRVVLHSIGSMSEEDLRHVWLPVGAIFDALRRG